MDLFHLPGGDGVDRQTFIGTGAASVFTPWYKPRGRNMLMIVAISSGAGGGGGCGKAIGAAGGGGGGGTGGGITRAVFPLFALPDVLYIQVAQGGQGGAGGSSASGSNASSGVVSIVLAYPNISSGVSTLLMSGTSAPSGGGGGTAAAAGSAGSGGTIATETNMVLVRWGTFTAIAATAGALGGAQTGAVGASVTPAGIILPGCGGAGSQSADFAGGGYNAIASSPYTAVGGGAAGSNAGSDGFKFAPFPVFYGGCGGGASNSTTGGRGGNGVMPGAGGGGGGAGVTSGGRGGDGGPGAVYMICW